MLIERINFYVMDFGQLFKEQRTYAFLFNADNPNLGGFYGYPCQNAFIKSLVLSDIQKTVYTRILDGDVLLHSFCREITEVSYKKVNEFSATYNMNKDLLVSLIWDLADSLCQNWSSLDFDELPLLLGSHNLYCITTLSISKVLAMQIDSNLHGSDGYLGCLETDLGNPLHRILFIKYLIESCCIKYGNVFYKYDELDGDEIRPLWANELGKEFVGVIPLDSISYEKIIPPLIFPEFDSQRGKVASNLIARKGKPSHLQQVGYELYINTFTDHSKKEFFDLDTKQGFEIIVPEEKLVKYALCYDNDDGKEKAKVFEKQLGITSKDWRYLAAQLVERLKESSTIRTRKTPYGIQYHADLQVLGLNGNVRTVRSAWITLDGKIIRLTSVFVAKKKHQKDGKAETPPVVLTEHNINDKWQQIFDLAKLKGIKVAEQTIPTPMLIEGYSEPIYDGLCGFAWILIPDARKGFGRWLRNNKIGYPGYRSGQCIPAETEGQSFERAKAYAEAFATVLKMNGIECYVDSRLD